MLAKLKQTLMLPQFALGIAESALNALLARSPKTKSNLRQLDGKILEIQLKSPELTVFLLFSEDRCDWLGTYDGEADCCITLQANILPKLSDKSRLTELINNKTLVLNGDIQVLQHFSALLENLEKSPAELFSPLLGDIVAQGLHNIGTSVLNTLQGKIKNDSQYMVENLMTERPVFVHRLQAVDFYDQIAELEMRVNQLEMRLNANAE